MKDLNRVQEQPGYVDQLLDRRIAPGVGAAKSACFEPVPRVVVRRGAVRRNVARIRRVRATRKLFEWERARVVVKKIVDGASEAEGPRFVKDS